MEYFALTSAFLDRDRLQRVGTSSWQDGEAAVRPRLTLERQVTSTLLPDCAIKAPAAEAEDRKSATAAVGYVTKLRRQCGGQRPFSRRGRSMTACHFVLLPDPTLNGPSFSP